MMGRKLSSLSLFSEFNFIHILHSSDNSLGALPFIEEKPHESFASISGPYYKESYSVVNPPSIKMYIEGKRKY